MPEYRAAVVDAGPKERDAVKFNGERAREDSHQSLIEIGGVLQQFAGDFDNTPGSAAELNPLNVGSATANAVTRCAKPEWVGSNAAILVTSLSSPTVSAPAEITVVFARMRSINCGSRTTGTV